MSQLKRGVRAPYTKANGVQIIWQEMRREEVQFIN